MKPYTFDVLSVDWDYFLPCIDDYDWGHGEDKSIFFDIVWSFRAYGRKLTDYGKENPPRAIQTVRVDQDELSSFIDNVLTRDRVGSIFKLFVCESHMSIWALMQSVREQVLDSSVFNVWNLDAHHDYHYGRKPEPGEEPDCATWAYQGKQERLIHQYHLIYPRWRKESPEPGDADVESYTDSLSYGFQNANLPRSFAFAFFCRSSAWTPPWEDKHWMNLLHEIELVIPKQWREKAFVDYALKPREFDEEAAHEQHLANQRALQANAELDRKRDEFHRQKANSMCLPS